MNDEDKELASLRRFGLRCCPYCGDHEVYRSRTEPLTWLDRCCALLLLQLVRCHRCEFRHYRPIFFFAPEYPPPIPAKEKRAKAHADSEERKRSA